MKKKVLKSGNKKAIWANRWFFFFLKKENQKIYQLENEKIICWDIRILAQYRHFGYQAPLINNRKLNLPKINKKLWKRCEYHASGHN